MDLNNGNGMVLPVAPMNGGYGNNGFLGGDGFGWLILVLLLAGNNGWGNGFNGGGMNSLYPFMNQSNQFNDGFQNLQLSNQISNIQTGVSGLSNQMCNSFASVEANANARQLASLQQMFDLSSQFQNCCCENRLATANLATTIVNDGNATRLAISDGIRSIYDKLCDQELQAERRENDNLRTQLNMANLAASQTAQTAQILADNARQTVALEQYLNPTPIPAYPVQNPNCCAQGCGFNGF